MLKTMKMTARCFGLIVLQLIIVCEIVRSSSVHTPRNRCIDYLHRMNLTLTDELTSCYKQCETATDNSIFYIPNGHMNFNDAVAVCKMLNGQLAQPLESRDSRNMIDCLRRTVQQDSYWIGLKGTARSGGEYTYRWLEPVSGGRRRLYRGSRAIKNATQTREACVGISSGNGQAVWESYPCGWSSRYICEFKSYKEPVAISSSTVRTSTLSTVSPVTSQGDEDEEEEEREQEEEEVQGRGLVLPVRITPTLEPLPDWFLRPSSSSSTTTKPTAGASHVHKNDTIARLDATIDLLNKRNRSTRYNNTYVMSLLHQMELGLESVSYEVEAHAGSNLSSEASGHGFDMIVTNLLSAGCRNVSRRVGAATLHSVCAEGANGTNKAIFGELRLNGSVMSALVPPGAVDADRHMILSESMLSLVVLNGNRTKMNAGLSYIPPSATTSLLQRFASDSANNVRVTHVESVCSFVDPVTAQMSTHGCETVPGADICSPVTCHCNHTTIFAVVLSVTTVTTPVPVWVIQYVTESISVACLLLTFYILYAVRRKMRNDRTVLQMNLVFALLMFHLLLLLHDLATRHDRACEIVAVLLHFFLLSSGCWMLVEGITLLLKTSGRIMTVSDEKCGSIRVAKFAVGWGVPALIAITAAVVGFSDGNYLRMDKVYEHATKCSQNITTTQLPNKYNRCFLESALSRYLFILTVPVPLSVVMVINLAITIKVGARVYQLSKDAENYKPAPQQRNPLKETTHLVTGLKAIVSLVPILGLPWIFGILVGLPDYESSVVFMYLNVLVNGLQGLLLFGLYCLHAKEVRRIVSHMWKKSQEDRKYNSSLRSKGATKQSVSLSLIRRKQSRALSVTSDLHHVTSPPHPPVVATKSWSK